MSNWFGHLVGGQAEALQQLREELRLDRADGHVPAVGGLVGAVERCAAVEQERLALVACRLPVDFIVHIICARMLTPSTIAASIT